MINLSMKFPKKDYGELINSMKPEIGQVSGRSREWIEEDSENFYVYIAAPDTVSFKASLGAFTRLLTMLQKLYKEVK